ncbi:MAG: hypothetical protein A2W31_00105 [Planctomycetes bacterium RBG_16_64_10]|nr:MAG: hypothetical protein A2W31_00105 [Planctomycetes bacterium RBG_16_64_10]
MVAVLAALGYALLRLPPALAEGYQRAMDLHPIGKIVYLAAVGTGALIVGLLATWGLVRVWRNTLRQRNDRRRRGLDPSQLSHRQRQREVAKNLALGDQLARVAEMADELRAEIRQRVLALQAKQASQKLEIVAFGSISSGKSSLLNALAGRDVFHTEVVGGTTPCRNEVPWPGSDRVVLVDTPGLAEVGGQLRAQAAAAAAHDADLVLCVVDGPLKAYELELLRALGAMEKRILVCLNKEDWFDARQRDELIGQIADQAAPTVSRDDVVAVRARPVPRRRVRVRADGSEIEETLNADPEIGELANRMLRIVQRDGRDLLLANLLLQSRGLVDDAQAKVMAALDAQAEQRIRRAMWAAGGAVAVNPVPLLDLAGGGAFTVKMVLELARVYRQDIDADTVVNLLAQLAKNLIATLGVTAATPAISAVLASLIKTVPGIGTLAGGLVQGLVQALVTRWIGKVFMAYFRQAMRAPAGGLVELARQKWHEVTQPDQLRQLIQAGRRQLQAPGAEAQEPTPDGGRRSEADLR